MVFVFYGGALIWFLYFKVGTYGFCILRRALMVFVL